MSAEVASIEGPYEDPVRDWRNSERKLYEGTLAQLMAERARGANVSYDSLGQIWRPFEMDDDEIKEVARNEARKSVEWAIRETESQMITDRVKRRQGKAL